VVIPESIQRRLRTLRAQREGIDVGFHRDVLVGGTVSCTRGCHHCCHYPLYVSLLEGILTYQWLSDHRLWVQELRNQFKSVAQQTWGLRMEVWMLSNIPCPLLNGEGLCHAYGGRPLYCRTIYSRAPSHYCHPHRFVEATAGLVPRTEPTKALAAAENQLFRSLKLNRTLLPFAVAVLYGEHITQGELDLRDATVLNLNDHKLW